MKKFAVIRKIGEMYMKNGEMWVNCTVKDIHLIAENDDYKQLFANTNTATQYDPAHKIWYSDTVVRRVEAKDEIDYANRINNRPLQYHKN